MPGGITFNHFDLTEETIQPPLTLRRTLPGGPGQGALSPALRVSRHLLPSELNRGGRGVSPAGTRGGGLCGPRFPHPHPAGRRRPPGPPGCPRLPAPAPRAAAPGFRQTRLSPPASRRRSGLALAARSPVPSGAFTSRLAARSSRVSGWPSGLRRQTQASLPALGASGLRMEAWVRIPLLTRSRFSFIVCNLT